MTISEVEKVQEAAVQVVNDLLDYLESIEPRDPAVVSELRLSAIEALQAEVLAIVALGDG